MREVQWGSVGGVCSSALDFSRKTITHRGQLRREASSEQMQLADIKNKRTNEMH